MGSATPMRGKSLTCRQLTLLFLGSPTLFGIILSGHRPSDLERLLGKSKTCRASAWQSHSVCSTPILENLLNKSQPAARKREPPVRTQRKAPGSALVKTVCSGETFALAARCGRDVRAPRTGMKRY